VAETGRFGTRIRSLSNYYTSLYSPVCTPGAKERHLARIVQHIIATNAPVISFRFDPMDVTANSFRWLERALSANRLYPFRYFCFGNWHLQVTGDWQAYLASRTGSLRSTIKRMEKKFSAQGGQVEVTTSVDNLERALQHYSAVYAASWKVPEPFQDFVPGLARTVQDRGGLRMAIAYLEGKPVAAQLWVVTQRKASIFKVAYDEAFKAYSPGTLLTASLMRHVIEQDHVTEVDYLTGDDDYKKTWMSHRRERWGIVAYNPITILGLAGLSRELMGRIWRLARARWQSRTVDHKPESTSPATAK
jgi:Acetyltransferase (GNAT) domain